MEEKRERYRIAEFAKMVGVDPSTVRYYEKHGLRGKKRDENGYRVFNRYDAFRMNNFRSIYARGFSIKEAVQMMEDPSREKLIQGLRRNCVDMERELLLLAERKRWAEETIHILELRQVGESMLWHMELPDFYFLPASVKGDFSITQKNGDVRDFWEKWLGYTRFVAIGDGEAFSRGERVRYDLGEAVTAESFERFRYLANETVRRIPMGECICFYTYGKECPDSENLSAHPEVQAYLEEHGLEGRGELLNFYLMLSVKEDGEGTGIVALPVRPRQK